MLNFHNISIVLFTILPIAFCLFVISIFSNIQLYMTMFQYCRSKSAKNILLLDDLIFGFRTQLSSRFYIISQPIHFGEYARTILFSTNMITIFINNLCAFLPHKYTRVLYLRSVNVGMGIGYTLAIIREYIVSEYISLSTCNYERL